VRVAVKIIVISSNYVRLNKKKEGLEITSEFDKNIQQ